MHSHPDSTQCSRSVFRLNSSSSFRLILDVYKRQHFHFFGKDFFIIFIIFPKQIRRIQFIRTFAFTLSAVKTILDLFHILLPLFVQPVCRRRSSYHQRHSRTVVDLDPCRTRHTISASPAKISGQFRLFFLDKMCIRDSPTAACSAFTERSRRSGDIAALLCRLFLYRRKWNVRAHDPEYGWRDLSGI